VATVSGQLEWTVIAVKLMETLGCAMQVRRRAGQNPVLAAVGLAIVLAGCGNGPSPLSSGQASGANVGEALEQEFVAVVKKVNPSVVLIQSSSGLGSGEVFDTKGNIVTNAHVVGNDTDFTVVSSDGRTSKATLVGSFPANDLAVIRTDATNLPPATFGDSSKLVVGEVVLAIGNPLGLQSSVTDGIVSALGRTLAEPNGAALPGLIQTSAAINPGNSGGALVNLDGEVIGIPTLAANDPQMGGAAPGIGFAIPSNAASDIAKQLVENGRVVDTHRAYLGIRAANVDPPVGVLVYSTDPGGPAEKAGIKPGMLIASIDGKATPDSAALSTVLANLAPGQTVTVKILNQDGSTQDVKVTLGELPG
jgi:S1-C subfamily serine protease